ncbi:metal binding domain of Ada-domain-containing protein [Fusarium flagelliforme]|uniref:Arac family transcriptional regulator n=1 Tax=Fusarium flagelliforme TaxID=2675880 RepID=A0A395N5G6_9HYPO|nr:metal binding domain of Ada-domain-containing protein [Fusarium flagelliforme]KAH7197903.1 metal binding domain of Ada-domain-containing protein [Fusarium flagelliforme]RFN55352.1 arac family transcriptional regulator [Fusarium flagelliforme]
MDSYNYTPASGEFLTIIASFDDDTSRWDAVTSRNTTADGLFVYAVRTTKIFCRPICKARLPRRANVSFFTNGHEAQQAGFRACKRCKPEVAGAMPEEAAVRKIRAFVQQHAERQDDTEVRLSLSQMARQTGLSKWHFHRVFKKCVGVTPTEYLRVKRQGLCLQNLLQTAETSSVDKFDFETLSQDYDTRTWDESVACSGYATTETPSTTLGDNPWSIDEFLIWPEKNQLPIAQDTSLT